MLDYALHGNYLGIRKLFMDGNTHRQLMKYSMGVPHTRTHTATCQDSRELCPGMYPVIILNMTF